MTVLDTKGSYSRCGPGLVVALVDQLAVRRRRRRSGGDRLLAFEPSTRASDATVIGIGAIIAAGLAPVVMKDMDSDSPMRMQTGNTMTMTTP